MTRVPRTAGLLDSSSRRCSSGSSRRRASSRSSRAARTHAARTGPSRSASSESSERPSPSSAATPGGARRHGDGPRGGRRRRSRGAARLLARRRRARCGGPGRRAASSSTPPSARSLRTCSGTTRLFSQDGTRAAWGEPRFGFFERKDRRAGPLRRRPRDGPRGRRPGLEPRDGRRSRSRRRGRRLAVLDGNDARGVRRDATRRTRSSSRPSGSRARRAALRLRRRGHDPPLPEVLQRRDRKDIAPPALEITEFSLPSKKSLVTGRFDRDALPYLRLSADGRFLVGTRGVRRSERLASRSTTAGPAPSSRPLATDLQSPQARFLSGDRIAVAGVAGCDGAGGFLRR